MLKPEQREAIYRLALQQQYAELSDYLDTLTAPEGWKLVPVEPTSEMVSEMEFQSGQFSDRRKILRAVIAAAPQPGESDER